MKVRKAAATWLAHQRLDTPRNFFATVVPWATGLLIAWLLPADGLAKAVAGGIAWGVVQSILFFWIFRTLPEEAKPVFGFSPLYTSAGRAQFRAEQAAIRQQIDQLSSRSARLATDMAKLDLTTAEGQEQIKLLSPQKAEIDRNLAALKSSARNIGFTAHMD
jgi:hypothetical protein